ncbi:carbohydrate-binding protein [Paracoccus beibuensis]|uniref:carbohydrate-binding protein n=1 Tax=Paracoccus beibuensis TaxID=547602 RepID=UPI00223FAF9C|nr:carbohydrate-binding protein [Paracoccus beibuensis]
MALPIVFQDTDFQIIDTATTVLRNASNPEANAGDPAQYTPEGLRLGYSGTGYLDLGGLNGPKFKIAIPASELDGSGNYGLVIKLANGGTGAATNRPIQVRHGDTVIVDVPNTNTTSFSVWETLNFNITLNQINGDGNYELTFFQSGDAGPNFDGVAIVAEGETYSFLAPEIDGDSFTLAEGETAAGAVKATDADGQSVTYEITGGADAAAVAIDAGTGAMTLVAPADFEAKAAYEVEVTATDRAGDATVQMVSIAVTDVNEAPAAPVFTLTAPLTEDTQSGEVVGVVVTSDPEGTAVTVSISDARLMVQDGQVIVAEGASFAAGESVELTLTATDGTLSSTSTVSLDVEATEEPVEAGIPVTFSASSVVTYAGVQDAGSDFAVTDGGATLQLNDNHWKRAFLSSDYVITADTKISVDVMIGANKPELILVGFDQDEQMNDREGNLYLLDGEHTDKLFVNMKGTGTPLENGAVRYVIDLGAHAGKSIDSLVFASDDDNPTVGGLGSVSFTNVKLIDDSVPVDLAPTVPVFTGSTTLPSGLSEGDVVGTLAATDPEGKPVTFTLNDDRFQVAGNQVVVAAGATFAEGEAITLAVTASDGSLTSNSTFTLTVESDDEEPAGSSLDVMFDNVVGYAGRQDGGRNFTVTDGGSTLEMNDNHWKRAFLGSSYTITENTVIAVDIVIGANMPELVGIGFDLNEDPIDRQASIYQLDGTESQVRFVNMVGTGTPVEGGATRFLIDLSAHAGKTIDSLVFVADDDRASDGLGSVSFGNVQLIEKGLIPDTNQAPEVVGGGFVDMSVVEGGPIEVDLPFLDPEGADLNFSFTVTDSTGADVTAQFGGLSFDGVVMTGTLPKLPGTFTVTVTANDGEAQNATASDSFQLTLQNVNDAPVTEDVALEPFFGAINEDFPAIRISDFAEYFNDPDGDALVLSVNPDTLPEGMTFDAAAGLILGTPTEGGNFAVEIIATDPGGLQTTLDIQVAIDAPQVGDTFTIEAENFTGLDEATGFFAAPAVGASGNQLIRTNTNEAGVVSTTLGNVPPGFYTISITVYDETDGDAPFSISVDGVSVSGDANFNDEGTWLNGNGSTGRGDAGQIGNRKMLSFDQVVYIGPDSVLTLSGMADMEVLRVDSLTLTRTLGGNLPPAAPSLDNATVAENAAGAVIGTLDATDPNGDAVTFSTDDARFVIEGDSLRLADGVSLDHEAGGTVQVSVTATDASGNATTATLDIAVEDVNEAPVIADGATIEDVALEQGAGVSIDVATALGATDPEGDGVTYVAQLADGSPLPAGITLEGGTLVVAADMPQGNYPIQIVASDGSLTSAPVEFTVNVGAAPEFVPFTIQAEDATISLSTAPDGDATVTVVRDPANPETGSFTGLRPGFTGTGYIDYGDDAGDTLGFDINVPEPGEYIIKIRYASQSAAGAPRVLDIAVNGEAATTTVFPSTGDDTNTSTGGFNNWGTLSIPVTLNAGANSFSLAIPAGITAGPNIDSIEVTRAEFEDISADADEKPLFISGPDGELSETQAASINFNLAGIDADIVKTQVSFDGGATLVEVFPDADGDFTVDGSALEPGSYTVTFIVTDEVGNQAQVTMPITVAAPDVDGILIQAEDASAVVVDDTGAPTDGGFTRVVDPDNPDAFGNYRAGAVGDAYVDFGANAGDAITITVDAPTAGTYLVSIRYANGGATNRPLDLSVNGTDSGSLDFAPGPVVNVNGQPNGWESWVVETVELQLAEGTNQIRLEIPAGATSGPNIDQLLFEYQDGDVVVPPFSATIEGESFTITDPEPTPDTVARTPENPEAGANAGNSGPGLEFDADGLRQGHEGDGYLDMGGEVGDSAGFSIDAPGAGVYQLTIRYANGSTADRPLSLSINGAEQTVSFPNSGGTTGTGLDWNVWAEVTLDVTLAAGPNQISFTNLTTAGPNIDNVTLSRDGDEVREQATFEEVVKINFQPPAGQTTSGLPAGFQTPDGYVADTGAAFGDRGNGLSFGWVTEGSVADGTANGTTPAAQPANAHWYKGTVDGASDLQKTYAHFEFPGAGSTGARAWEMALEDGTYQVTMSVGDTAGAFDSTYVINVEGQSFMPTWVPANPVDGSTDGEGFRSTLVTGIVTVTDGRLTVDSIGGQNTEIQYLEIEKIPDLTPDDDRSADQDYSFFVAPVAASLDGQTSIAIGEDGSLPTDIDPTSSFVVGVNLQAPGNRGPNISYVDNVKLVETLTGVEVAIDVQISGGADSMTIRPLGNLKENTSYTLKVQDVLDLGSVTDADAPLRQMQDLTTTFVTGLAPVDVPREVAFDTTVLLNGFADGAGGFTGVEFGPDGKLYVATITGEIHRWTVNNDGSLDRNSHETLSLDYLDAGGGERRGIVGMVFDPNDPNTIYITDNAPIPRESKAFETPEFSGRISKITLGESGSFEDVQAETFAFGFPRSGGDHLTNSLEFRPNPAFGAEGEPEYLLYLTQGSNTAAGQADNAWGNRPERLLNAAILEVDVSKEAPPGGFDVRTEPISLADNPTKTFPASEFNEDGTYPGSYNPFAEDAPIKIFATGVRNAYDLVWHSNGQLYVPTNGTAAGGKTPADPTQPYDETIDNSPKQYDYFFTVEEGGYYGHPNALRDEYILNGGNPTSGLDPNEVVGGNDGNSSTDGYQVGVQPDANYDLDGVYNLGYNRSPNGATEYTGNAFGSNLKGAILFAQFSTGDNVRAILVNEAGEIIGDDVLRRPDGSVIDDYIDPLDIIENPLTGQLYLMTLNRGTGASQLILLTPAPGGITQDISADADGNLALAAFDVSDPAAAVFQVNGLDDDITAIRVSFNGGPETTVTLDANDRFTIDLGALSGDVVATIEVTDDALNTATASTTFVPGDEPEQPDFVSLITIQAEDDTAVTLPTSPDAQIAIRDIDSADTGAAAFPFSLRPGAFGLDGNTDSSDGVPGGYADFGSTNADFMTFTFDVPAGNAGQAQLQFRYVNGGAGDRPLQVEVNGSIVTVTPFPPTGTGDAGWSNWQVVTIPAALVAGTNTVTLRAVNNIGPNIDQFEVLVSNQDEEPGGDGTEVVDGVTYVVYEAENADTGGAAVVNEDRNQSGGFVDFNGTANQTLTWTVNVSEGGSYALDILYALASTKTARPMVLTVNGAVVDTLAFVPNSDTGETIWGPQSALVDLVGGANTISVTAPAGNGPNVDYLRVTQEPLEAFEPVPAEIDGSGRIELEANDGSADIRTGSEVVFYFTVAEDGVYRLDAAANMGAPNGQGLTWFLNGVELDETAFPGAGVAGEESVFASLEAGTTYEIRVVSDAPGASQIDYLDISPSGGNPNASIAVASLDPAFFDDRLHFSYLENPVQDGVTRDYKDAGTIRISNTGTEPLSIEEAGLTGPFQITQPASLAGVSIAPGSFLDVTVTFDRSAYSPPTSNIDGTSTVFEGRLRLQTNDADDPITDIDLAGFWQARPEGGQEPNVNEVWRIFGFGNRIEGLTFNGGGENSTLSTNDVFAKTDETEVLSPYWKLADGVTQARITHIAAFHGPGGATIGIHNPGNKGQDSTLWDHQGTDNQRLLPNWGNDTTFASRVIEAGTIPAGWVGNGVFGIEVAGLSTDPRLNPTGGVVVPGAQQGHTVKMFQALDGNGNVIPNVYLGVMDYTGINYDYNDNMFVIEGVAPVGFGQNLELSGLDDAAADDRLVFTSIDEPATAQQQFRNEAVVTLTNDGFAAVDISSIVVGDPSNFQIVGTIPDTIPAGGSAQVTVRFIGTHAGTSAGAEIHKSTLTVTSDDLAKPQIVVQLAGIAQEFSERGSEPTVSQVVEAFGYSTDMAESQLANGGQVETVGDEVLMPYMQALDPSQGVQVIQLAAFLQYGNVARLSMHGLQSADTTELFAQDDLQAQTVLPDGHVAGAANSGGTARATITGDDPFGLFIAVDGRPTYASWTDPEANRIDPDFGQLVGENQGHLVRFFQALDGDGNVIDGTYIAIQDYPGAGNYDYNDHMFIIKNVKPYQLTDADDADGDGVNDALQLDLDGDSVVDFFDPDTVVDPGPGGQGAFVLGVNFGGGAIAMDPVLGVPLVGQSDSRVTLTGQINPGAGVDAPSNLNGAGATPGSAFTTYEDGANWTANIAVDNGTYLVTLWTQETYWNSAGKRQFDAYVNGQQVINNLDPFAEAGGDEPISVQVVVTVTNGQISINMDADIDNAPLNAVTIHEYSTNVAEPGQTPFDGTPFVVADDAIAIDASDYDDGGQGVAYNDQAGLQGGTNGGRAGSDVEQTGAGHIGWIQNGEWLEYTIDVAEDGLYDVNFLSAFGATGARSIEASFRKGGVPYESTGAVTVDPTGGWTTFAETDSATVQLEAGVQVMRVAFSGGSMDLAAINLTPAAVAALAAISGDSRQAILAEPLEAEVQQPFDLLPEDAVNETHAPFGHVFDHDLIA